MRMVQGGEDCRRQSLNVFRIKVATPLRLNLSTPNPPNKNLQT